MTNEPSSGKAPHFASSRNWLSLAGLVTILASIFSFLFLFVMDLFSGNSNPYVGVLTFFVAPAFSTLGLTMFVVGIVLRHRSLKKLNKSASSSWIIDLSRLRDRRILIGFVTGSVLFLFVSAFGSYHSYKYTESTTFCGQTCHTVMEPEMVTYLHSPHARVSCVECHIGPGATWFVKSKLSGLYQVYAAAADKFPRPIPTPIKNLRPARDTCEHCHWPEKFSGDMVRTYRHFLSDEENTEYAVVMLLKVGGGTPDRGPVGGIHWHMSADSKVEYIATDEKRLDIPWVRLTDADGTVTEYRTPEFTDDIAGMPIRTMDCIDCHNRPAHRYQKPNEAIDLAISMGEIDRNIPEIRLAASELLSAEDYETKEMALESIATQLNERYPDEARIGPAIAAVQDIYSRNFFPEMKADWRQYPEHIGHKDWPGCVRCHDDNHWSADGTQSINFSDCNSCHVILAQGAGAELEQLSPAGQPFRHPEEAYDPDFKCNDCHTGGF